MSGTALLRENRSPARLPAWLEVDWLLASFGERRAIALQRYIELVAGGVGSPSLWKAQVHPHYLGDHTFIEKIGSLYTNENDTDLKEVPRMQRRPMAQPLGNYSTQYANPKQARVAAYSTGD